MFDLRRAMLLCDLAEFGTVSAVAARRSITSSAVSQQLRVLEKEIGAVLFRRDGRTLSLTLCGEVLVEHVRQVISAMDQAVSAVAAARDNISGHIAISGFEASIPTLAAPVVRRLSQEAPDLQVRVSQALTDSSLRALRRGEVDVVLAGRLDMEKADPVSGLVRKDLFYDPLVLLSPLKLHARVRARGLPALADEPWVTCGPDGPLAAVLDRAAARAGFEPNVKHQVVGSAVICRVAATEVASAIVPRIAVPTDVVPLIVGGLDLGGRMISVIYREGMQYNPSIKVLLRALLQVVADRQAESADEQLAEAS
jgi:DNA-binding transcriptional LysR family regulator